VRRRSPSARFGRILFGIAAAGALAAAGGCRARVVSTPPARGEAHEDRWSVARIVADADDLEAALIVAAGRQTVAIEEQHEPEPGRVVFRLRTAAGPPGVLEASWNPEEGSPTEIVLRARLGHFGDPEAERTLLRRTARRLEQLRGPGAAPLRR